ncbi:AtpZ/AtpI family protein [Blastochloris viridis]|uniref:ATP synthase protein I n=1 Tax=Blastochloris viridis TaxID=1079 RepID=A0A0H5BBI7_BLAVI|nr:AtpZ/AtpI family protein [Blastochloris viridis]ALK10446.1 ATP synthase protein I [Blastochloris viridis]BAR99612.1 ATP synthase protein I [Blastochloris viridis]CUU43108.1 ATP synthase protein I [Blastochloris viridis]
MTDGTGNRPDGDGKRPSEAELAARLERLGRKIDLLKGKEAPEPTNGERPADSGIYGRATRLSSEFVGGILVGGGLGWLTDYFLGTSPLGMIVFVLLGFAAGVVNVIRGAGTQGGPGPGSPGR